MVAQIGFAPTCHKHFLNVPLIVWQNTAQVYLLTLFVRNIHLKIYCTRISYKFSSAVPEQVGINTNLINYKYNDFTSLDSQADAL